MWEFEQVRNEKLAARVVKNFEARGFEACYAATKEEAKEKALSYIRPDDVIGWGGCFSAEDVGLMDELRSDRYPNAIDRDTAKSPEEKKKMMRAMFSADVFIGGANGISEDPGATASRPRRGARTQ